MIVEIEYQQSGVLRACREDRHENSNVAAGYAPSGRKTFLENLRLEALFPTLLRNCNTALRPARIAVLP